MSNTTYFEEFNAMVEQLKGVDGKSMLWSKQFIEIANGGSLISVDEEKEDEERFLAVIFIIRSDYNRFGDLIKDLLRDDITGTDNYSTTVVKGFELLQGYETKELTSNKNGRAQGGGNEGNTNNGGGNQNGNTPRVSFSQTGEDNVIVPGTDSTTLDKQSIRCIKCQKRGHLTDFKWTTRYTIFHDGCILHHPQ